MVILIHKLLLLIKLYMLAGTPYKLHQLPNIDLLDYVILVLLQDVCYRNFKLMVLFLMMLHLLIVQIGLLLPSLKMDLIHLC
jgi:hypothetical protein